MDQEFDLVIRNGDVVDGSGRPAFIANVGVRDGLIAAVGEMPMVGREEIEADGLLVTPGFVDIHTHYDGQITWDDTLLPSSRHGVTTVVTGNCGVGFAPCRPEQRDMMIKLMEGVEDIPEAVMREGIPWSWATFPEYLDTLEKKAWDIDVATQVPHAAVRVYVMGQRAVDREPALPAEVAQMATVVREAVEAGALGFSTSRTILHRRKDGVLGPTITAGENELLAIGRALGEAGRGVLQMVDDFTDPVQEFAMWRRIVEASGRPLSFSLAQRSWEGENWRVLLAQLEAANDAGLDIKGQVIGRPLGLLFGLRLSLNPLSVFPSFRALADLPIAEKLMELRKPDVRSRILCDSPDFADPQVAGFLSRFDEMYILGDPPKYAPAPEQSIAARAAAKGVPPLELLYELLVEKDGENIIYAPLANFVNNSLENAGVMLAHRDTIPGIGDGGAHYGMVCDGTIPTFLLSYWARDAASRRLPLPFVVKRLTWDCARAVRLEDRGLIAPGYRADLNVIDFGRLALGAPYPVNDLPAGGRRLMQRAEGYAVTIVNGVVIARDGVDTGARPGRLIRGARPAPVGVAAPT